jgi:hypothetical protein
MCQVDPNAYTDAIEVFSELVRKNRDLHSALVSDNVEFNKTSCVLAKILEDEYSKRRVSFDLQASDKSALDGDLGVLVHVTFKCPNTAYAKTMTFEILDPRELYRAYKHWDCECGYMHTCTALGKIA